MAQIVIILSDEGVELDDTTYSGLSDAENRDLANALAEFTVVDVRVMK